VLAPEEVPDLVDQRPGDALTVDPDDREVLAVFVAVPAPTDP
jgi:hypothetical protein